MRGLLFDLRSVLRSLRRSPALAAAAAALLLAALFACWLPARRAGAVDPMRSLRAELPGRGINTLERPT